MVTAAKEKTLWRMLVVGGHTRSIGKTQLVCDIISAFPQTNWIAGKITQYGHGVCATNGENCDCAPTEHVCALDWETHSDTGTDSARFLQAGAAKSFWLRTKQGYLAEGLPLLRDALKEVANHESERQSAIKNQQPEREQALIIESNSLLQFVKPSLYFAVIDPLKDDFKESAQIALDRAHALVLRAVPGTIPRTDTRAALATDDAPPSHLWMNLPAQLMREKPSVLQREGGPLPVPLWELVHRMLEAPPSTSF